MEYSPKFEDALLYARRLHAGQERKGSGIPYIIHLLSVAALTAEYGGDEDQVIAGLLHDAAEDQGGRATLDEIRRRFGERVARIVEGCTDSFDGEPRPPWRARKETYVRRLATEPEDVLLVSAADKLHNARCINIDLRRVGARVWERFSGGRDDRLWYYHALAEAYARRMQNALVEDLRHAVSEMDRLAASPSKIR